MEPVSSPAEVFAQMTQLSLQTNGSASSATAAATNPIPAAIVTPVTPVKNSNSSAPRQRTGIPRYAIPYRRPDNNPHVDGSVQSPVSPAVSETASGCQQAMPRGRNGFRTESLGDDCLSSPFSRGAPQRYGRAASVGELRFFEISAESYQYVLDTVLYLLGGG
ncbi:unnamed protein product [Taenia asiatica]|uniref:Uncharacterized protein n=1 Tax=Taenia asiatica TaxID=60517 RepID=A0A0R3WAG4_TAEAS|nr:unnamed protein product [Taenia asiatica]